MMKFVIKELIDIDEGSLNWGVISNHVIPREKTMVYIIILLSFITFNIG